MGEEDQTMLECSLHRHLEIADVLFVMGKMVLGHSFTVEEPCTVCSEIIEKDYFFVHVQVHVEIVIHLS